MQIIYKYPLNHSFCTTKLSLPKLHEVLDVQMQDGKLVLWCRINKDCTEMVDVTITIVGTGWDIKEDIGVYISTGQHEGYVFHAFYKV